MILESLEQAVRNFAGIFACISGPCSLVQPSGSGFLFALFVMLLLTGVGAWASGLLLQACAGLRAGPGSPFTRTAVFTRTAAVAASAVIWLWLAFGHAVPQFAGTEDLLRWATLVPLDTAFLAAGVILPGSLLLFVAAGIRRRRLLIPEPSADRLLVMLLLVGLVAAWRFVFVSRPEFDALPLTEGPSWVRDGLMVWALEWPVMTLWHWASFLATGSGLATFGALAAAAVVLPALTLQRKATSLMSRAVDGATALLETLILGTVLLAAATLPLLVSLEEFLYVTGFLVFAVAMIALAGRFRIQ